MVTFLTVIHITVCLFLILVVLLQAGKGGGMGIAFGGAGSQTVFGSSGAGNFLTRLTSVTATVFLLTSLALAHYSSRQDSKRLQELAAQKAVEKKVETEKTNKLKADMEKARAAAAAKNAAGGLSAPAGAAGAVGTGVATPPPPLQLKMPGQSAPDVGAAGRLMKTSPTENSGATKAAPPTTGEKKPGAATERSRTQAAPSVGVKSPATEAPGTTSVGGDGARDTDGATSPPAPARRRKAAPLTGATPPATGEGEPADPTPPATPSPATAPAAPAE